MIYLYQGTPGSGKSFHAVSRIYSLLRYTNTNVICNFPIDLERVFFTNTGYFKLWLMRNFKLHFKKIDAKPVKNHFHYLENSDMKIDYLHRFCEENHKYKALKIDGAEQRIYFEDQTLLVIDEATILFNCRGWQDKTRQDWCKFFSQHRKFGYNIILIAQNEKMLDKQIRYNVEMMVDHKNCKYYNWFAKLLSLFCGGSLFVSLYRWQGCKDIMKRELYRYSSRIASIYNSYLIFTERTGSTG